MLSIIIPTLDEADALPRTLDGVARAAAGGPAFEVIVADASGNGKTLEVARARGALAFRASRAQRAAQMNEGAAHARGETLLFLHADTVPPPGALEQVLAVCRRPRVVGGAFARRYDSPSRWLRLTCWLAHQRNRWFGWHLGDQAIFVRRSVFEELGGFDDLDVFEDVDFSRRLAQQGKLVTLHPPVLTSARRFVERGVVRRTLADAWLTWRYVLGTPTPRLGDARVKPLSPPPTALPIVPSVEPLRRDAQHVET